MPPRRLAALPKALAAGTVLPIFCTAAKKDIGVPELLDAISKYALSPVQGKQRPATKGTGDKAQRVSVFIYDPSKIQVHSSDLAPRSIGTAEISVGRSSGYSVAVTQNGGVGYAVASDLDAEHSAQLAALANEDY